MDSHLNTRSLPLIVSVLAALGLGVLLLYTLDVVTYEDDFDSYSMSYSDAEFIMDLDGKSWLRNLTLIGLGIAGVAAVALTVAQREVQAVIISAGAVAAMAGPIWIATTVENGEKVGSGVIASVVCFAIAAALPWVLKVVTPQRWDAEMAR